MTRKVMRRILSMKMSMANELRSSEQIEEAAAQWFVRQQSGIWSAADQAEFEAWLGAATAHRIHYLRVSTTWDYAARLKALGAGVPVGSIPSRGSWGDARYFKGTAEPPQAPAPREVASSEVSARSRLRRALAVAASVGFLLVAAAIFNSRTDYFTAEHYTTKVGGLNNVPLADGSNVTLNTDSSIRVALAHDERRIRLEKGEAFFEVAKDRTKPFVVYAGDKRVVAVGTKFSVRRDGKEIQVVVTEGRVRLAEADEKDASIVPTEGSNKTRQSIGEPQRESIFLDAGAVAHASDSSIEVSQDTESNAARLLAWRTGYVAFQNTPLADAVTEFNRYITRKIVIEDPSIATIVVGGNFRFNNTTAFLDLLQTGFPVVVEMHEDRIALRAR
jgi:transmembrane sensor